MHISPAEAAECEPHLRALGVTAGYAGLPVIREMTLAVARGQVVTVIGPNGAGKSTLLKAILGILPLMAGEVLLDGRRIDGLAVDQVARAGVGYVPQVRDVFDSLSVKENLDMGGYQLNRRAVAGRVEEVLQVFPALRQLLRRSAGSLSGGERKMVAIGRLLMTRPTMVILDEPTAGLAPQLADQFLSEQVSRLARQNVAVLLVEQRAREALSISDFAYVLAGGSIKIAGAASEILARPDLSDVFLGLVAEG